MRFDYLDAPSGGAEPVKVADLPSAINHHWTKALAAMLTGASPLRGIGPTATH